MQKWRTRLRPKEGLVRGCSELQLIPWLPILQPGADSAHGAETDEGMVDEIGRDLPVFQPNRERLLEIELAEGVYVLAVAANNYREQRKSDGLRGVQAQLGREGRQHDPGIEPGTGNASRLRFASERKML